MADFVFNIACGKGVEYYSRVYANDPANSALILVVIAASGIETDAVLRDYDTLSALLAATNNEVTNTGYARKTLTDAVLTAPAPDDTNNWFLVDLPDQTWTAVSAGDVWAKLLVCYDSDTTAGTDANIVPLTAHDFAYTPNGGDIPAVFPSGFLRAASAT